MINTCEILFLLQISYPNFLFIYKIMLEYKSLFLCIKDLPDQVQKPLHVQPKNQNLE